MDPTFDDDTAVTRTASDRYVGRIVPGYSVPGGAPNGGYLTALAARALSDRLGVPDPLTVTTHYLASPSQAPVEIVTEAMKDTGRHRTGSARVLQAGREVVRITGTFTELASASGPTVLRGAPPKLPAPSDCLDVGAHEHLPEMFGKANLRVTPASLAWTTGTSTGEGIVEGWTGIRDSEHVSTLAMLFLADAIPPPIFNFSEIAFGWMPTLELTVQVRAVPAPGPLAVRFATRFVTDGYLELDGEMWDSTGRLVGLARQTALAPRPA